MDEHRSAFTRRHFLGALGAGAASLALVGCGDGGGAGQAVPEGSGGGSIAGKRIRVAAFTNNHAAAPLYWPQFAPEGLEVEVTTLTSGTDMNRALEADDLDFAIFGIVNGFIESEQGLGSKIVAMGARQGAGLVVPRQSDIADVPGLRGKRIALKGPAFQLLALYALLGEAGLDPDADVEIVPVEYNDQPAALEQGDVDAFMGSEPNASRSVVSNVGRRLVNIYTTPIGQLNSTIWASPRMLAEEPDLVRAAVAMQRDAANHLTPGGTKRPRGVARSRRQPVRPGGTHLPRAHHQHRGGVGALRLLDRPGQGGRGQDGGARPPAGRARRRRPHPNGVPAGLSRLHGTDRLPGAFGRLDQFLSALTDST
jgi:ABC-type nitrate/sulfonate/bicarbonate transport system substrate-binding protein